MDYSELQGEDKDRFDKKIASFRKWIQRDIPDTEISWGNSLKHYVCYTDGSCDNIKPPHVGGAAYYILHEFREWKQRAAGFVNTTNNRMEMLAIISAVNTCPAGAYVDIYSDSQYAIQAFHLDYRPGKNVELLEKFVDVCEGKSGVRSFWVKGHDGNYWNEKADELAFQAYADKCKEIGVQVSTSPYVVGGRSKQ